MSLRKKLIIFSILGVILLGGTFLGIKIFKPSKQPNRNVNQLETENLYLDKPNENLGSYLKENKYKEDSLINLLFIASGEMDKINYQVKTDGIASPRLVVKMPDQIIKAKRQKQGHDFYHEIITYGPKNEAWEIYTTGDNNFVKTSKNIDKANLTAVYEPKDVSNYTNNDFKESMGIGSKSLSPYILNKHTVLNANLILESPNELKVKYTLEPNKSTYYYQNDVKSRGGSDKYPFFKYVHLEIIFDNNYLIKEMKVFEEYELNVGATATITSEVTYSFNFEDFTFFGPDKFKDFMHLAQKPIEPSTRDGLFYIQNALLGDLTSKKGLTLSGEVKINEETLPVKVNMSMLTGAITISINDFLFVKSEGDTLYFKINNNTGKIISDDIKLNLGGNSANLGAITNDVTVEKDGNLVKVNLKLTDDITLTFNFNELDFINLTGKFTIYNQDIEVNVSKSNEELECDFSDAVDYSSVVNDIKSLINNPNFKVELPKTKILTNEENLPIYFSGILNINLSSGLYANGEVIVLFNEEEYLIDIKIYDETIYLNYNDSIKVKLEFKDISDLILLIDENYELDFILDDLQSYDNLKIDAFIFHVIKSLELSNDPNNLSFKLNLGEKIGDVIAKFKDDKINLTFPLDINVAITRTEEVSINKVNEVDYIDYETVSKVLKDIKAFIETNVYEFNFNTIIKEKPLTLTGQVLNGETINFDINLTYDFLNINIRKQEESISFTIGDYKIIFENQEDLINLIGLILEKYGIIEEETINQIKEFFEKDYDILAYLDSFKAKAIIDEIKFTKEGVFLNLDNNLIELLNGTIKIESGLDNEVGTRNVLTIFPKESYDISENNSKKQLLLNDKSLNLIYELVSLFTYNNNHMVNVSFTNEEFSFNLDIIIENLFTDLRMSAEGLLNLKGEEISFKLYANKDDIILKVGPICYGITLNELKGLFKVEDVDLKLHEVDLINTIINLITILLDANNLDITITDEVLSVVVLDPLLEKLGLNQLNIEYKERILSLSLNDLHVKLSSTDQEVIELAANDNYLINIDSSITLLDKEIPITGNIYLNLKSLDIKGVITLGETELELIKKDNIYQVKVLGNTFELNEEVLKLLISEFINKDQVISNTNFNDILNKLQLLMTDNQISLFDGKVTITPTINQEVALSANDQIVINIQNYQVIINLINRLKGLNQLSGTLNYEGLSINLTGNLDLFKGLADFKGNFDYKGITGTVEGGLANDEITLLAFKTYFKVSIDELINLILEQNNQLDLVSVTLTDNLLIIKSNSLTITYDNLLDKIIISNDLLNLSLEEGYNEISTYNPVSYYGLNDLIQAKDLVMELLEVTERNYDHLSFTGDLDNYLINGVFKYLKYSETYEVNVTLTDKTSLDVHDLKFMENNGNIYFNYNGLKALISKTEFYSILDLVLTWLEIQEKDKILELLQNKNLSLDNNEDEVSINLDELINKINLGKNFISANTTEGDFSISTLDILPKINLILSNANIEIDILDTEPTLSKVMDIEFHNLNNSYNLVEAALNTVDLKTYSFLGGIKLNMLIYNFEVKNFKLLIDNRVNKDLKIYAEFIVPRTTIITDCETQNKVYIKDGYVYLDQVKKTYKLSWFQWKLNKTEYIKRIWTQEEFEANLVDNIMMMFNFNSIITDQVDKQSNSESKIDISKVLKSYKPISDERYDVLLNGPELTNDNLKDINLNIYIVNNLLHKLDIATGYSIFSITGSFTMQPHDSWTDIDFSTFGNL